MLTQSGSPVMYVEHFRLFFYHHQWEWAQGIQVYFITTPSKNIFMQKNFYQENVWFTSQTNKNIRSSHALDK